MSTHSFALVRLNNTAQPGVRSASFSNRDTFDKRGDDGGLHLSSSNIRRSAPMANFTTVAVRSLLSRLTLNAAAPYLALDGTNGIDLIGAKSGATPGLDATAVHARRQFKSGLLVVDRLSWSIGGDAVQAVCSAFATATTGSTDPVTSGTVATPTIPTNTEALTTSDITIGGSTFPRCHAWEIAITHQVENNSDECYDFGKQFPTLLRQPGAGGPVEVVATLDTYDLNTAIANGALAITCNVKNHLGVGYGATGFTATLNSTHIRERNLPGNAGSPAARQIEVHATWNGTLLPLSLATF